MNVSAIGNFFAAKPETAGSLAQKPVETAGILAFGGAETAGSLANNAGGSFCAMAQAKLSSIEKKTTIQSGWIMNEVKLANYTLMAVMLVTMATFCLSLNTFNKSTDLTNVPTFSIIAGYSYQANEIMR